jgi:hypothetical protein
MLRARQEITDVANMLESGHFNGNPLREGCDKAKTAKVTAQMRAAADALNILDDLDFQGVIADDGPNQTQVERYAQQVRAEKVLTKQNEPELHDADGVPAELGNIEDL